ncbi:MAG: glycosyltransferase [Spirochaetales bacterium]|nr:glycosyltransferase [Spirochaetales bacterium]
MNRRKPYKLYILETDKTRVSVIIPTLNQEKLIGKCIESLLCQSYQQSLIEIIVVDNGSTDKTVDIAKKYPVKLISETKKGPAAARNAGIKIATGEILIFLDHDCFADKDFVAYHVWAHNHNMKIDNRVKLIAGGIAGYNTNLWAFCDDICSWYNSHPKLPSRYESDYLPAANMSIASDVIDMLGGFEAGMIGGEDVVLCAKIKEHGFKIYFEPKAKVYHYNRNTFRGFINHAKLWAKDELDLRRKEINRTKNNSTRMCAPSVAHKGMSVPNMSRIILSLAMYIRRYIKGIVKIITFCLLARRYYVFILLPFIVLNTVIFGIHTIKADINYKVELKESFSLSAS